MTPMKSAITERAPMHKPPKVAAMGMYLFKWCLRPYSLEPTRPIPYSLSYLATSLTEEPETWIQVLENKAQVVRMKTT